MTHRGRAVSPRRRAHRRVVLVHGVVLERGEHGDQREQKEREEEEQCEKDASDDGERGHGE
jgi:hypothetical protein